MRTELNSYYYCYSKGNVGECLRKDSTKASFNGIDKSVPKSNQIEELIPIITRNNAIEELVPKITRTEPIELGYILSRCLAMIPSLDEIDKLFDTVEEDNGNYNNIFKFNENEVYIFNNFMLESIKRTILEYDSLGEKLKGIKSFVDLCAENTKYCSIEYLNVLLNCKPFYGEHFISHEINFALWDDIGFKDDIVLFNTDYKKIFDSYEKNKAQINVYYKCRYNDLIDLCIASLYNIFDKGFVIKKCINCEAYFVPINRTDTIYCNKISPQDNSKTCKEYGAAQAYKDKLKTDEASGLYRAIYMQKQMLTRRNPDIQQYKIDFETYKKESRQWKQDIKNGVRRNDAYITWLKGIKENK